MKTILRFSAAALLGFALTAIATTPTIPATHPEPQGTTSLPFPCPPCTPSLK
jgi:hypothetical protein